jgi:hypothetical protein
VVVPRPRRQPRPAGRRRLQPHIAAIRLTRHPETYPGVRSDFERSFRALRDLPADVFLGSHSSWFNIRAKRRAQLAAPDGANPFIDPQGYRDYIDDAERAFRDALAEHP